MTAWGRAARVRSALKPRLYLMTEIAWQSVALKAGGGLTTAVSLICQA
jgi:hypothetical protein